MLLLQISNVVTAPGFWKSQFCLFCPECPISTEFRKSNSHQAACHHFQIERQILWCLLKRPCTWVRSGKKFAVSPQEPCLNSALTRRQILLCREIPRFMLSQNESNWIRDGWVFERWFTESKRLLQESSSRDLSGQGLSRFQIWGHQRPAPKTSIALESSGCSDSVALRYVVRCCDVLQYQIKIFRLMFSDGKSDFGWFWHILVLSK